MREASSVLRRGFLEAMNTRQIVIIGGGCSGTLLAAQMLRQAREAVQIVLIERTPPVGRGVAYRTRYEGHLLNVPADRMSAWPNDPSHFLRWARSNGKRVDYAKPVNSGDYLPRYVYSTYLATVLEEARAAAIPEASLGVLSREAIDLEEIGEGARITLSDGSTIIAASVVLALGNLPGEYPIRRPLPFFHSRRYVHIPWATNALEGLDESDDILLVGAGLTAIDIILQYRANGHKGVVHALSRHGLRPQAHKEGLQQIASSLPVDSLPTTVRDAFTAVRRAVRRARERGLDWRSVVDSIRPVSQQLWQGFSVEERARFMRHVRPFWEAHRHRLAPECAAIVAELEAAGRLKFHAGRLTSLRDLADGAAAVIKIRGKEDFMALRVAKVINCTGPRTDYSKYQHPLLINLLAAGLITHDPLALGISALSTGEVLRYNQKPAKWLYTIGAPLKGVLWESTAVPEIRIQACNLATRMLALETSKNDRPVPASAA